MMILNFIYQCIGVIILTCFFVDNDIKQRNNILIFIITSLLLSIIQSLHLYILNPFVYVAYISIMNRKIMTQTLLILSSFSIIDKIILDIVVLVLLFFTRQQYHQLINNYSIMCLIYLLSRSIEYLVLTKYKEKLSYMIYRKQNKLHVFAVILNFVIIISFYYIDINLISYDRFSFSYAFLLYLSLITIYIFSSSYIYQTKVTVEIQETLRLYNYQYLYLEELYEMQKKYLKQNHDMRALLYRYADKQNVTQYLEKEDILPIFTTGDHTLDIVCNYYLNKYQYDIMTNIKEEIKIDKKIIMKVLDMILLLTKDKNLKIEIYCENMFTIRIILYNHETLTFSKEINHFFMMNHFDLIENDKYIAIIRYNHS